MNSAIKKGTDGWFAAVNLCETYMSRPRKVDDLLASLSDRLPQDERRRCQFLLYGVIRNLRLIAWAIESLVDREPRRRLKSILFVAAAEILGDRRGKGPEIVDHAVGVAKRWLSSREADFINAILRKTAIRLAEAVEDRHEIENLEPDEFVSRLSLAYSHPRWMVKRWRGRFSEALVRRLVQWNQEPAVTYLYLRKGIRDNSGLGLALSSWPGFYPIVGSEWELVTHLISQGKAFITDPANRLSVGLLEARPGESILDLCAAPGGKVCW